MLMVQSKEVLKNQDVPVRLAPQIQVFSQKPNSAMDIRHGCASNAHR
jgi:hypothetical protein